MSSFEIIETMAQIIELQTALITKMAKSLEEMEAVTGELSGPELSEIARLKQKINKES